MLISSISRVGPRSAQTGRSAAPRASRPQASTPVAVPGVSIQDEAGEGADGDDPLARGQQLGMTLAAAQAAYASN
jgi:hypothetical protein